MPRRTYATEIARLPQAYKHALGFDVAALARALGACGRGPLLAIGSGGSFSAAHLAARLHETVLGGVARAATPLESISALPRGAGTAILLSAGGRNPDALAAFRALTADGDARAMVLCCEPQSPLARLAQRNQRATLAGIHLPFGRDGYLATSSLLSFAVILARAYEMVSGAATLPATFDELVGNSVIGAVSDLREKTARFWQRLSTVTLYDPFSSPGAIDLESKFVESALGPVLISDFRNFAHGRHLWLARNGETTSVLAFVSPAAQELAERTLQLVPAAIPKALVTMKRDGPAAMIESLITAILLTAVAAQAKGVEVARPRVPRFGRQLYHLRAVAARGKSRSASPVDTAISRKRHAGPGSNIDWPAAYNRFVVQLGKARFRGIVLDYDGTLCEARDRFRGVSAVVRAPLLRLLRTGIRFAIATGRGRSAGDALRSALPRRFHPLVLVGYYQGAITAPLSHLSALDEAHVPNEMLVAVAALLEGDERISSIAAITARRFQITASLHDPTREVEAWTLINEVIATKFTIPLCVLRSSHSIDVLAPGVTKKSVVDALRAQLGAARGEILCIGDRGRWPGNDSILLSGDYALSVDEVSSDPNGCWHIAPHGVAGVRATAYYLSHLDFRAGSARFRVPASD